MGDGPRNVEVIPDYFAVSASNGDSHPERISDASISGSDSPRTSTSCSISHLKGNSFKLHPSTDSSTRPVVNCLLSRKKLRSASFMLKLFSLGPLRFISMNKEEKIELSAVELESLRSELADIEEREARLKAQLEHLDKILQCARLSGYLCTRMRWAALPGELPPIDDCDVDDWIPRFVVLQGPCIYFYQSSTDMSPLDSTLLADIVEVGQLPSLERREEEIRHCFYIVTRYGLRIECSSVSRIQVDSWLTALRADCKFEADNPDPVDKNCKNNSQNSV